MKSSADVVTGVLAREWVGGFPFLVLCMYCGINAHMGFGVNWRIIKDMVLYGGAVCMVGRGLWAF